MTQLIICGQAPSRVGDGRAFTGPSGRRLAALFGLKNYEELAARVMLTNIFDQPAAPRRLPARRRTKYNASGDEFDQYLARDRAQELLKQWAGMDDRVVVIACGHAVYQAIIGEPGTFFKGKRRLGVEVWCFPHPSGASSYWNYHSNKLAAANFLRRLLNHAGMMIAE